jgi:NAD(P)H-hydrate epimerase
VPSLATGGTGDVLTGLVGALLAQGLEPFDAARLGAWVHGRSGALAARQLGPVSVAAGDVAEHLPAAFEELLEGSGEPHERGGLRPPRAPRPGEPVDLDGPP